MTDTRICLFCERFRVWPGSPGYSEVTPGEDAEIHCEKGHWRIRLYSDYANDYRRKLSTAKTCPDWTPCQLLQEQR